jgi:hypothetical protein
LDGEGGGFRGDLLNVRVGDGGGKGRVVGSRIVVGVYEILISGRKFVEGCLRVR